MPYTVTLESWNRICNYQFLLQNNNLEINNIFKIRRGASRRALYNQRGVKMVIIQITIISAFLSLFALLSCTSRPVVITNDSGNTPASSANLSLARYSGETFEEKWGNLIQVARKEKTVIVYNSQPQGVRALINIFKDKFGVSIETVGGTTAAMTSRIVSEHRVGINLVDILLTGRSSPPFELLEPLGPSLLLPELTEPELIKKTWWRGQLWWVDDNPTMLASQAAPSSLLVINTNLVKPGDLSSYNDLLNPKWKGQIVMVDPYDSNGLQSLKVVSTQIMSKNWEFARELAKQEPVIIFDNRLQMEWVARGRYAIAFAPSSGVVAEFQEAGAPIDFVTPREGIYVGSGSSIVTMIKQAPHPAAAKLFINFFLSNEGQTIFTKTIGVHSAREDVPIEGINLNKLRQPGVKYYFPELQTPKDKEIVKEIFERLSK